MGSDVALLALILLQCFSSETVDPHVLTINLRLYFEVQERSGWSEASHLTSAVQLLGDRALAYSADIEQVESQNNLNLSGAL